jgi:hypothetical protein
MSSQRNFRGHILNRITPGSVFARMIAGRMMTARKHPPSVKNLMGRMSVLIGAAARIATHPRSTPIRLLTACSGSVSAVTTLMSHAAAPAR